MKGQGWSMENAACEEWLETLPDRSVPLFLVDPPYYNVKGDFDKVWPTRGAYLRAVARWASLMERKIADNGSLIWFCGYRMEPYIHVILAKYFSFLNSCTVVKENGVQRKAEIAKLRMWLSNDERFLFFQSNGRTALDGDGAKTARGKHRYAEGMALQRCMKPIVDYLNEERERAGFSVADVCKAFGMFVPEHWFTRKSQWQLPSWERYGQLRALFNAKGGDFLRREYDDLRQEYDDLRREYDDLRRAFSVEERQSDVFSIVVDSGIGVRLGHPTVKHLPLIRQLVRATTRPGDLVVDCFAGSGTTGIAALAEGRRFAGCELDAKYYDIACRRIAETAPGLGI